MGARRVHRFVQNRLLEQHICNIEMNQFVSSWSTIPCDAQSVYAKSCRQIRKSKWSARPVTDTSLWQKLRSYIGLVTLDVEMPVLNGLETLAELRKVDRKLPVVMFSTSRTGGGATLDACRWAHPTMPPSHKYRKPGGGSPRRFGQN